MTDGGFGGPSMTVLERWSLAQQSPRYGHDERAAGLPELIIGGAVQEWSALPEEVRGFLEDCIRDVHNGHSHTLQHPDAWGGDWQAEDEALEQAEDGELADDTRARAGRPPEFTDDPDDLDDGPKGKGFDFDDPEDVEWVGV